LFEFFQRIVIAAGEPLDGMLQAMIDVILDQGAFGLAHGFFHGVKLLGDIHTGTTLFNHGENAAQVPSARFNLLLTAA
jgi:hypothetical protein